MAELIFEKFNLDKNLLIPVKTNDMKWNAKRPKDSSLDVTRATSILDNKPQTLQDNLNKLYDEINIK